MNRIILVGRLGRDAEMKTFQSGKAVLQFSLATDDGPKGPDGKPTAQWHSCKSFSEFHLKVQPYLLKGKQVAVEGRVQYRKTDDGKTYTDVLIDRVELLGSKGDSAGQGAGYAERQNANAFAPRKPASAPPPPAGETDWGADDDPIPF